MTRIQMLRLLRASGEYFARQTSADLAEYGVCVMEIAEALGVSQPTASRHVDSLRQAGFISVRLKGKWSYCKREEEALGEYIAWLAEGTGTKVDGG